MKLLNSKGIASTTVIIVAIIVIIAAVAGVYLVVMKPTTAAPAFKIAVVSDIGGRGDLSFNDMAFKGGEEAERDFNVQMVELISQTESDYLPNLRTAASDPDVQLIVGVGFLLTQDLVTAAHEFPDKNFMGIDTYTKWIAAEGIKEVGEALPNLMDIVYEEHKGSALVGALGALLATHYNKPHIGGVFGIEIPTLWKFEIGYKWGADWAISWYENNYPDNSAAEPATSIVKTPIKERVLYTYTGTFSDITKGYTAALPMYEENAVAVYNIAGPLGLGINSVVRDIARRDGLEQGPPFWIGVDANQDWINPGFVIASMMKRVDRGVYYTTKWVKDNTFRYLVENYGGQITLGIGTEVSGTLTEGISISTLADLGEFVQMGVKAEELTGEPVLLGSPEWISTKVSTMRDAQPSWIWNAVAELEGKIRSGEVLVPLADTADTVAYWRNILG
jgi:basic membrane protein A